MSAPRRAPTKDPPPSRYSPLKRTCMVLARSADVRYNSGRPSGTNADGGIRGRTLLPRLERTSDMATFTRTYMVMIP